MTDSMHDTLDASLARHHAAEVAAAYARGAADVAAKVEALAAEYDERSRDTEDAVRYPWGVAADDLRAALTEARP